MTSRKIEIRPEQAKFILKLSAKADRAQEACNLAIGVALAGLVKEGSELQEIKPDGTVTVEEPKESD